MAEDVNARDRVRRLREMCEDLEARGLTRDIATRRATREIVVFGGDEALSELAVHALDVASLADARGEAISVLLAQLHASGIENARLREQVVELRAQLRDSRRVVAA